jgi:DNA-binding transcriptional LysR family regulator
VKHSLPSLDALKVFESAARHLSFSCAAEELCITKGAVSYQIAKLESELDCALFRRAVRQVFLTESGQELMLVTQRHFRELGQTLRQISPIESNHDILCAATTYVALRWLSSRIAEFCEQFPDITILLQHAVNSDNFSIQDVDLAIRWDQIGKYSEREHLKELPMPLFPVCSPELLQRYGYKSNEKLKIEQLYSLPLNSIPLLCEDRRLDLWQAWCGDRQPPLNNPRRVIIDANVRTQAAMDGQGWIMADDLMQREIETGVLVAPFTEKLTGFGYVIRASTGRYANKNVRIFRDWLLATV